MQLACSATTLLRKQRRRSCRIRRTMSPRSMSIRRQRGRGGVDPARTIDVDYAAARLSKPILPHWRACIPATLRSSMRVGTARCSSFATWSMPDPRHSSSYDRAQREATLLFYDQPALLGYELAPMSPIEFTARDGLAIHGYLTMPPGVGRPGAHGSLRARRSMVSRPLVLRTRRSMVGKSGLRRLAGQLPRIDRLR